MKITSMNIQETLKKAAFKALGTAATQTKKTAFFAAGSVISIGAFAAPDSDKVNAQAGIINTFIEGVLNGEVGYLFTLISFFVGIGFAISKREWMPAFYGFGIAIMILIVPDAMKNLFSGIS